MNRLPQGRYSQEFREEAVKLVRETGISVSEASSRLSLPKSTLDHWVKSAIKGTLGEIGKGQRPVTDVELELSRVKKDLARVTMERDILKKAAA